MKELADGLRRLLGQPRVLGGISLALVIVALGSTLAMGSRRPADNYEILVQDAPDPAELLRLADLLCRERIEHRIQDGGRSLWVSGTDRERAVELVMAEGLSPVARPATGGEDFFGLTGGLAASHEDHRSRERREREGELARTLSLYPAVQFARVHLNRPETGTLGERQKPSVSVFLGLRPFRRLSAAQARGIRKLVGNAIDGLDPERVTLADSWGTDYERLLREDDERGIREMAERLDFLRAAEASAETRVRDHLARMLGEENVLVRVALQLCEARGPGASAGGLALASGRPEAAVESVREVRVARIGVTLNARLFLPDAPHPETLGMVRNVVRSALDLDPSVADRVEIAAVPFGIAHTTAVADGEAREASPQAVTASAAGVAESCGASLVGGLLLLFLGSLGVVATTREAPMPEPVGEHPEVDPSSLRGDAVVRRAVATSWAEEDPAFAARVVLGLLEEDRG